MHGCTHPHICTHPHVYTHTHVHTHTHTHTHTRVCTPTHTCTHTHTHTHIHTHTHTHTHTQPVILAGPFLGTYTLMPEQSSMVISPLNLFQAASTKLQPGRLISNSDKPKMKPKMKPKIIYRQHWTLLLIHAELIIISLLNI